jgi:hypothetical protein
MRQIFKDGVVLLEKKWLLQLLQESICEGTNHRAFLFVGGFPN